MHVPPDSHHCLLERLLRADEAVMLSSWLQWIWQWLTHVHFNKNAILQNCDPTKIAVITQQINWLIESQYIIKDTKQTVDARCIYIFFNFTIYFHRLVFVHTDLLVYVIGRIIQTCGLLVQSYLFSSEEINIINKPRILNTICLDGMNPSSVWLIHVRNTDIASILD